MMRSIGILLLALVSNSLAASPLNDLKEESPSVYQLVNDYSKYQAGFTAYAAQQGFRRPYEKLATVAHEMIHLASATHAGYFIDGVYYEPYIGAEHWPSLRNRDVAPLMRTEERGLIHSVYMRATPDNNLGNILDEVNAYTHVLPFVCKHEAESAPRQAQNLIGHLHVVEAYLRVARTSRPTEYAALQKNRLSSGAIVTITSRAWAALQGCGLPSAQLPNQEATYFARSLR